MSYEVDANGYMVNHGEWTEDIAREIAKTEDIPELTARHFDVINFLRDEYINNGGNQPNDRNILKAMKEVWAGEKVDSKSLYELFPKQPSKQATKIAGLPETRRKGGY
jgi:tRNA 2-thiouridine synthesizing protein E